MLRNHNLNRYQFIFIHFVEMTVEKPIVDGCISCINLYTTNSYFIKHNKTTLVKYNNLEEY